jgi:hypothetical protein
VLILLAALAGAALGTAGAAEAGDLVVLAPDTATISGPLAYDHVYVGAGATLRLAGDTSISAADVYIAGGANLDTCFVPPSSNNGCTAGRNLTIGSSGQINIGSGIDLEAGSGTPRPGGSLVLQGAGVAVAGGIDTAGSAGGGSGSVTVASSGPIALSSAYYQASVYAPGAAVSIHGTTVSLSGDLDTYGSDPNITSAGPIDVGAATGPLNIHGNVNAGGRDSSGGNGASVTLRGTDVNVGQIDASAGSSSVGAPGAAGTVDAAGTTSLSISGSIDTRGSSGPTTFGATGGGNIHLASGGPVVAGTIYASGANADSAPPSGGGSVVIAAAGVTTGQIFTNGGSRSTSAGPGATGNNVAISSTGAVSVGDVEAFGGNGVGPGWAGGGGGQIVISGTGVITSELRTTSGSSSGTAPGAPAGAIHVTGSTYVSILGGVYANGSSGGGTFNPPMPGGNGGAVTLHATAGQLSLGAPINTSGGNGGNAPGGAEAGPGGTGGSVDLVGTPIDPIVGISSEGGDGGFSNSNDNRGVGGNGGTVHAWSETNIFGGLRSISTAGGGGAPPGVDGAQLVDSAPSGPTVDATGLLSFTSNSPFAEGYNIYQSIGGAPPTLVLTTRSTSRVAVPPVALCTPVTYDVSAYASAVGWTSPPTAPVAFLRQPSATQKCTDAPSLAHGTKSVLLKAASLKKHKGVFTFVVQANGLGSVTATATTKGVKKPIGTVTVPAAKAGSLKVTLKLDLKAKFKYSLVKGRQIARVSVKLVAAAPTGSSKTSITVPVEVRK